MTFIVKIIIWILFIFVENVRSNEIELMVENVCGKRNNCSEERSVKLPVDSCCRQCECEDVCFEKRTCCPDKYEQNTVNVTKQVCLPSASYAKTYKDYRVFPHYFVRAKCPESYKDQLTRGKCENSEPESILDIPFVSSKNGSVVYKNRHCATCFGELDIIPWKMMIGWSCITDIYIDNDGNKVSFNQTFLIDAFLNKCTLSFVRPKSTSWETTFCYKSDDLLSRCPESNYYWSGFQNVVFYELKRKCEKDKKALSFFKKNSQLGYANVYCFLCNKGNQSGTCITDGPFKSVSDFSFLLNHGSLTAGNTDLREKCTQYQYHDRFFGVCRTLRCPILRFAKQGKCVSSITQKSSKVNFKFEIKLSPTVQSPQNDSEIQALSRLLPNLLQNELKFHNCEICRLKVLGEKSNGSVTEIYTSFIFTTTPKCVERHILSTATTLQDNQMINRYKTIKWKQVPYKIEYISSEELFKNLTRNTVPLFRKMSVCRYFVSSKFENCAKIILSQQEYQVMANNSDMENVHVAKLYNDEFEICVSDFEEITNPKRSNGVKNTATILFLHLTAIFKLLYII